MARVGERRDACKVLVEKPQGKRPIGRSTHRWGHNSFIVMTYFNCCDYFLIVMTMYSYCMFIYDYPN